MKLLSLELIGRYKGLADQAFDFSEASGSILAFIGLNGSGKSQLMESIAEIFAYLERRQRKDFRTRSGLGFCFNIAYEISAVHDEQLRLMHFSVQLDADGRIHITRRPRLMATDQAGGAEEGQWQVAETCELDELPLPHMIGYASGLSENLQRSFMRNAVQYFDVMTVRAHRREELSQKNVDERLVVTINQKYRSRYPGIFGAQTGDEEADPLRTSESDTPLPAAVFLDYDCTNLVVVALGMLPSEERDRLWPEVRFRHPGKVVLRYDLRGVPVAQDSIEDLRQLIRTVGGDKVSGLGTRTDDEQYELYELDHLNAELTFDFLDAELRHRLAETYVDPATLFWKLYKLQLLGVGRWAPEIRKSLREDAFVGHVKKPLKGRLPLSVVDLQLSDGRKLVAIDDLSDGETQQLHTVGAVRLFSSSECLSLFDEPETHLNPSWRTRFHLDVRQALGDQSSSQVLISSHSPFLISSLRRDCVFYFERIDGVTGMAPAAAETFGASFEVLIKKHFGLRSAISQTAVDEIRERLKSDPQDAESKRQWLEEQLGESMERAYLLKRLEG
jgi:predicted ATPase